MSGVPAELGPTLRAWRERLPAPEDGEPRVRHTPGLRRSEVAVLAGISTDYLTQLEQGRARTPSDLVLTALAKALRLSTAERDHAFELAGRRAPERVGRLPASVLEVLPRLQVPAALCNSAWDLVDWNRQWSAIVGDVRGLPVDERNILLRHFRGRPTRFTRTSEQEEFFERGMVADLRRSLGRSGSRRLRTVVDTLAAESARFRSIWAAPAAAPYDRDTKNMSDPVLGPFELDCVVLDTRDLDHRVILLSAEPGSTGDAVIRRAGSA